MISQITIYKILDSLISKIWILVLVFVLSAIVAFAAVRDIYPDTYRATSTVYSQSNNSFEEALEGMTIIGDYSEIVNSYTVAEIAAQMMETEMNPADIQSMVFSSVNNSVSLVYVSAVHSDPDVATEVANAVAMAFVEHTNSLIESRSVEVLDEARSASLITDGANTMWLNRIVISILPVMLVFVVIVFTAMFNNKVIYKQEATLFGRIELLGIIPSKKDLE